MEIETICQNCIYTEMLRLFPIAIELPDSYRPIWIGRVTGIDCYRFLGQFLVKINNQWKAQLFS